MSTSPPLPGALGTLAPLLDHYGYLAVAGLITLEDFGVPVPGEMVLIAVAAAVIAGVFVIVLIVRHVLPHHRRRETTKRSP
jgi:membrane protein DedA with SNARE-associated domain